MSGDLDLFFLQDYWTACESALESEGETPQEIESDVFEVEKILDHRSVGYANEYLIKWKGYEIDWATWEPEANVENSHDLLKEYRGPCRNIFGK